MEKFDSNTYAFKKLLQHVPEINNLEGDLKKTFLDHQDHESPLVTLIYEDVLCPYFLSLIKKTDKESKDITKRIINLIEELANHDDFEVRCIAQVGFLERLVHDMNPRKDLEKYLLPASLELAKEIAWDRFGLDHRIEWKKAKYHRFPYEKYFGIIPNKPEVTDKELQDIYDKIYREEIHKVMPGGVAWALKKQVEKGKNLTYLPIAEILLCEIIKIIENKKSFLSQEDLETAKVIMYNLRDSISLAKNYMANPIKLPHTKNHVENRENNHEETNPEK
jgi:hypothetical protein